MLPINFKPQGTYNLLRIGGDHDGGYLVELKSIEQTEALISMGIGKNWKFEEDFIAHKDIKIHAYDHSIRGLFWIKFFIKRFLSVLIGRLHAPYAAITTYTNFLHFFRDKAVLFYEKIGTEEENCTNLKKTIERIKEKPIFLKIDIEGYEYEILDEIILNSQFLSGMVIEFHNCDLQKDTIKSFMGNFKLKLVHLHVNNWGIINSKRFPSSIELTFSPEEYNQNIKDEKYSFPTVLDQPCNPLFQDLPIEFE